MNDFFAHQDRARASTRWLLFYFTLSALFLAALLVVGTVFLVPDQFGLNREIYAVTAESMPRLLQSLDWLRVSELTLAIVLFVYLISLFKMWSLAHGGGSAVADSLGGRLVLPTTDNDQERVLMNVVEEMSIASGVPMPEVYVLDHDTTINAFAAGTSVDRAVVAVTRGTLEQLSRDELQGVIAHEFSHILNGDMLLNLRLVGVLFGILCIRQAGYVLFRFGANSSSSRRSRSNDEKNPAAFLVAFGGLLFVFGGIGFILGSWIKAAVCRQREFLADASAVQFTRNPQGLGGALVKISQVGAKLVSPRASEMNHFFLASGVSGFLSLATHPPIKTRIERVLGEAAAKGLEETSDPALPRAPGSLGEQVAGIAPRSANMSHASAAPAFANPMQTVAASAPKRSASVDRPPEALLAATNDAYSATALAYLCLLGDDIQPTEDLWSGLSESAGALIAGATKTLRAQVGTVAPRYRIDLLSRSMASLRQLSSEQGRQFLAGAKLIIELDGRVHVHEYLAWRLLKHALREHTPRQKDIDETEQGRVASTKVLLSAMAQQGGGSESEQQAAFAAGWRVVSSGAAPAMPSWTNAQLGAAMTKLEHSQGDWKKKVLDACAVTARQDDVLTLEEFDMLRTVALLLGAPIPPPALS